MFYSNFVLKMHRFWDIRLDTVTLKPGLGSFKLKVIETDTDRSAAYTTSDFLLTFHSNHGPISYRFRDKRRCQSKIAVPRVFCTPAEGVPLRTSYRRMGLPGRKRSLTISSAFCIQFTNVTDRRTDTGRQQRPRLRIASRGKNEIGALN